jgi:uncharacterized protein (DUF1697 family)
MPEHDDVYVAFLRGINVGGNNMVSMKALKGSFERLGLDEVSTYINSGNVVFRASETDARALEARIDRMLSLEYRLTGKTVVRSRAEMGRLLKTIAKNWTKLDPGSRYNVIFLRHTIDSKRILDAIQLNADIEEVIYCPGTLLWSARISDLTRAAMLKLASRPIYRDMTVRNINTTTKVFELMQRVADTTATASPRRPTRATASSAGDSRRQPAGRRRGRS